VRFEIAKVANLQEVHFSLKDLFQRLATFNPYDILTCILLFPGDFDIN